MVVTPQMGFYLSDRYASLDAKRGPLVEIDAVVPRDGGRPLLEWGAAQHLLRQARSPVVRVRLPPPRDGGAGDRAVPADSSGAARWLARAPGHCALPPLCIAPRMAYLARIGGDHFEYRPLDFYWPLLAAPASMGIVRIGAQMAGVRWQRTLIQFDHMTVQVDGGSEFMKEPAATPTSPPRLLAPTVTAASSAATAPCASSLIRPPGRPHRQRSEPGTGPVSQRPLPRPAPPSHRLVGTVRVRGQALHGCLNEKIPQCPESVQKVQSGQQFQYDT